MTRFGVGVVSFGSWPLFGPRRLRLKMETSKFDTQMDPLQTGRGIKWTKKKYKRLGGETGESKRVGELQKDLTLHQAPRRWAGGAGGGQAGVLGLSSASRRFATSVGVRLLEERTKCSGENKILSKWKTVVGKGKPWKTWR